MLADIDTTLTPHDVYCIAFAGQALTLGGEGGEGGGDGPDGVGGVGPAVHFLTFCFKPFGSVIVYLPLV